MPVYIEPANTGCTIPITVLLEAADPIEENPTLSFDCEFIAFEKRDDGSVLVTVRPTSLSWVGEDSNTYFAEIHDGPRIVVPADSLEEWIAT